MRSQTPDKKEREAASLWAVLGLSSREDIVQVKLILTAMADFRAIDQAYAQWLPDRGEVPYPTRTAFQAAALPAGARVMMEVVALFPE